MELQERFRKEKNMFASDISLIFVSDFKSVQLFPKAKGMWETIS